MTSPGADVAESRQASRLRVDALVQDLITAIEVELQKPATRDGSLTLSGPERAALESILGFGSTRDGAMIVSSVRRLASLQIGSVTIDFSVPQWQEIARRAEKRRQTVGAWLQQTVDRLMQDIWTSV